jgi:hypothetical protein
MRLRTTARRSGYAFLLIALGCLAFSAWGTSDAGDAGDAGDISATANNPTPAVTHPVIGPVVVTATPTVSASTASLTCSVHSAEGSEDDETQQTLTCTVKQAPPTDTQFILHYGARDPAGSVHSFTQTCSGLLRKGAGSCSQVYEFVFAFSPVPAPVTGEALPSHRALGPATPST